VFSTGWHLHQSLIDRKTRGNAFVSRDETQLLSPVGRHFLAGVLTHARAASPFATPTTNGYKRFHVANSMAPIQAIWAHDNRGVMIRALGAPHDPTTHLENRVGEPLANPYLYMSSQIHAGFDGMTRKLEPPPSADTPYELRAEPLPRSLAEAIDALDASTAMRGGFGDVFVDYILTIKRAELARAAQHPDGDDEPGGTSAWEHQEYFDAA
jgi:glutamine synthetase